MNKLTLEEKVKEAIDGLKPLPNQTEYTPADWVRDILQEQQAEIERLKAQQVESNK